MTDTIDFKTKLKDAGATFINDNDTNEEQVCKVCNATMIQRDTHVTCHKDNLNKVLSVLQHYNGDNSIVDILKNKSDYVHIISSYFYAMAD